MPLSTDESLEKLDRKLLIVALLGAMLAGSALLRDDLLVRFFKKSGSGEVIGRVIAKKNDVRRRLNQSLTWYEAFNNEAVEEQDSLFTGSESELTIQLLGDQMLTIEASSLVVMHTKNDQILLDLQLGAVASYANTSQIIKVMSEGQVTTIKAEKDATPVFIKKNAQGSLTIVSRTGEIEVGVGDKKTKLEMNKSLTVDRAFMVAKNPGHVASVESEQTKIMEPTKPYGPPKPPPLVKGARPLPVRLVENVVLKFNDSVNARSPASVSKGLLNPPELDWVPLENAQDYALEISTSDKFEKPVLYESLESSGVIWKEVKPGVYFWRVKARGFYDDESLWSEPAKLTVKLSAPKLLVPAIENETVDRPDLLSQEREVKIKWSEIPMATAYRFIASTNSETRQASIVNATHTTIKIPPNESVELKVATVDAKGRSTSEYSTENLSFKRELVVKAPQIYLPNDKTTIVAFDSKRIAPMIFAWKKSKGVQNYDIQFADDASFKNIIAEKIVSKNQFVLSEKFSNSETYWRVRARFDSYFSSWSEPRSFEIKAVSQ